MIAIETIILDANILISAGSNLRSASLYLLLEKCEQAGIRVCIPVIALDEAVNKWRERHQSNGESMNRMIKEYNELSGNDSIRSVPDEILEQHWDAFEKSFRDNIARIGVCVLPIPQVSHDELVALDIKKTKPFGGKKSGYRDALIWNTVMSQAETLSQRIAFISQNWTDFASSSDAKGVLHPDLTEMMQRRGLDPDHIELMNDINQFNEAYLTAALQKLDSLASDLLGEEHEVIDLRGILEQEIRKSITNLDELMPDAFGFTEEVIHVYSDNSVDLVNVSNVAARHLSVREVVLEVDAFVISEFEITVDNRSSNAWSWNHAVNSTFSTHTKEIEFFIRSQIIVDEIDGSVRGFDLLQLGEDAESLSIMYESTNSSSAASSISATALGQLERHEHKTKHKAVIFTPRSPQ